MIVLDIETTGLYPSPPPPHKPSHIVAIGVLDDFDLQIFSAPHIVFQSTPIEDVEAAIISKFIRWLGNHKEDFFVTYNGRLFDIPFIATKLTQQNRHDEAESILNYPNTDLINYAKFATGRRLQKDDACRKLGNLYVPRKTEGMWNARIYSNPQLLTENDHFEMLHHNAVDLTATARLYRTILRFPDYNEWQEKQIDDIVEERDTPEREGA